MFTRHRLKPGTARFEAYYQVNPEKKALDDAFRKKPGLMHPGSTFWDPVAFAAAEAGFETVAAFHPMLEREPAKRKPVAIPPGEMTVFLKKMVEKAGGGFSGNHGAEGLSSV